MGNEFGHPGWIDFPREGNGFVDDTVTHLTNYDPMYVEDHKEWLKLYIPARSAVVLRKL